MIWLPIFLHTVTRYSGRILNEKILHNIMQSTPRTEQKRRAGKCNQDALAQEIISCTPSTNIHNHTHTIFSTSEGENLWKMSFSQD